MTWRERVGEIVGARSPKGTQWIRVVFVALCLGAGVAVVLNPQLGLGVFLAAVGLMAVGAPSIAWVTAAVIAALTFRGLVTAGILPPVATFVDIPLAWGALIVALLKRREAARDAPSAARWLAFFALAVAFSWLFHHSEVIRPFVYVALLGEPFALLGALLLDPPSARQRAGTVRVLTLLLLIQLPVMLWQIARFGIGDPVEGTLYGAGSGTKVMAGVMAVGGIWILSRKDLSRGVRLTLGGVLLALPVVAFVWQVVLAVPCALVFVPWKRKRVGVTLTASVVLLSILALVWVAPPVYVRYLRSASQGQGGKVAAVKVVWDAVASDPESFLFGKGPAETVSRAAFMTTDLFLTPDSPIRSLHLHPAAYPLEAQNLAGAQIGRNSFSRISSFNSGVSSALGVLGDLGIVGASTYLLLLGSIFLAVRKRRSAEAVAAAAGLALFGVLGVVYDWWEQPGFDLFLMVLVGLALTTSSGVSAGLTAGRRITERSDRRAVRPSSLRPFDTGVR